MQPVVGPAVDDVGQPAGCLGLKPFAEFLVVVGEITVGGSHHAVEQHGLMASGDQDPHGAPG